MTDQTLSLGSTVAIQKEALNTLISILVDKGYQTIAPNIKDEVVSYQAISSTETLPQGYVSEQEKGYYRVKNNGHQRFVDLALFIQFHRWNLQSLFKYLPRLW